jgi:hypothetical protein
MTRFILPLTLSLLFSCNGANYVSSEQNAAAAAATGANPDKPLIDTQKLKSDLNDVLNSISSGKPDTNKLKAAASDILSTDATVLSDSGIDQFGGNSNDPAVKSAVEALKKMRNSIGITPDKLDSIKKAANQLTAN